MSQRESLEILLDEPAAWADRPAIVEVGRHGSRVLTYARLGARAEALGRGMAAAGVAEGEPVAILADPDAAWISVFLGLLRRRAVAVPLDTQLDAEQFERIINDAGIKRVVTDGERLPTLEQAHFDGEIIRIDLDDEGTQSWRQWLSDDGQAPAPAQPGDTALLFYTSGTTGSPKGVPLKHEHLAFQVRSVAHAGVVTDTDRLLLPMPLHHVYPLVMGVLAPLYLGLPVIFPAAISGPELIRAVRESDATVIVGVPRLYTALLDGVDRRLGEQSWPARALLQGLWSLCSTIRQKTRVNAGRLLLKPLRKRLGPSLRVMASGGSPLPPMAARRLEGLGWDVVIGYGLTETAPLLTLNLPDAGHLDTVGRPIDGIEIRIDPAAGPEEEDGGDAHGEILARGPGIFDGYLNLDGETAESFTGDGWFRTGDLGWFDDDGYLHVAGRKSTMIVTPGGENIRTEALEERYEKEPLFADVGILLEDEELVAVIHPDPDAMRQASGDVRQAIGSALREISKALPSYQRVSRYRISSEPLGRTRLGKLQRHKLKERYRALGSESDDTRGEPLSREQMKPADRELLDNDKARQTWELLASHYKTFRLTPDTSFQLDLGIDSLGWFDLTIAIAQRTGIELGEQDIREIHTVRDMLRMVAERREAEGDLVTPLERPREILSAEQKKRLEPQSAFLRATARALDALNRLLMKSLFRLQVAGGRSLPDTGPVILAPNHASVLDPFAVAAAVPAGFRRQLYWGGWTGIAFRNVLFRGFSSLARVVPVDPERSLMSSLAFAAAILEDGNNLAWFPEGERSESGDLGELRPGIGALLEQFPRVAVVPVRIEGGFEAWPRGRRLPRPRRITVTFGRALTVDELEAKGSGDTKRDRILSGLRQVMQARD